VRSMASLPWPCGPGVGRREPRNSALPTLTKKLSIVLIQLGGSDVTVTYEAASKRDLNRIKIRELSLETNLRWNDAMGKSRNAGVNAGQERSR
jgi:hypothetical protein